ncbi:UDP-4-amino-4,6-dideoxy-N-acetyl-beta-L-altrosamine transaminase [Geobacillus kaustophilus]|uniref:UDP-4-amino-4, 6-dideoxy-N-acetyl-beta-L-altrosamine transaminase n=1 Tax=Geobacillus kaustophilus TaxID=1462 RepID=A0A0D8BY32_GEOKU|nr:UDP-4-amino-4,6-dideoxy-N-acetyl-beta-L-altrosamine transaminase [Geobacillus kaustophilus]KJE29098.1 UDP-4-amino-4,6-dideoxy-N-acetyl-beta-L-altrosamine transaminase [Geobacillus kaustophilus]
MKLAIDGGTPVRESFLSYGQQWIDEEDIEAVVKTLRSPFITQGPKIEQFEEAIARYVGAKYAVAFANGTAALHGACFAAGISPGDEVVTTPITFAASANCVLYVGGTPVFVDIDEKTYNIDPNLIEEAITSRTKAIIAVDFTGQPADLDPIREIARKYGLVFIEDAAHSLGACYKGKKVGSLADMTMFSFHPVKPITTGEGGVIVTDHEEYYLKLKRFRTHGITTENVRKNEGPWYYEMVDLGYNYRMTDVQAALGLSQLTKLDAFVQKRREIAAMYHEAFSRIPGVRIPYQLPYVDSSWHLYVLQLQLENFRVGRKEIFEALRAENIGVHVHYIPVYFHPYYQQLGYKKGICPVAEKWYEAVLTIPLFPKMSEYDIRTVMEGVNKVLSFYRK